MSVRPGQTPHEILPPSAELVGSSPRRRGLVRSPGPTSRTVGASPCRRNGKGLARPERTPARLPSDSPVSRSPRRRGLARSARSHNSTVPSAPAAGQGLPVRGERNRSHPIRSGSSAAYRGGAAWPGRPGPTTAPTPRRLRWPGSVRPGRTPPSHSPPDRPVSGLPRRRGLARSARSHSSTVPSSPVLPAVARVCPSGANATEYHQSEWPVSGSPRRRGLARSVRSHNSTVTVVAGAGQGPPVWGERYEYTRRRVALECSGVVSRSQRVDQAKLGVSVRVRSCGLPVRGVRQCEDHDHGWTRPARQAGGQLQAAAVPAQAPAVPARLVAGRMPPPPRPARQRAGR